MDINKILRVENCETVRLSKYASIVIPNPKDPEEKVFVEYLLEKTTSVAHLKVLDLHKEAPRPSWIDTILNYLKDGSLPSYKKEASSIIYKATNCTIINGFLSKQGFNLRC